MMNLRSEFAINHAIRGFGMDFERALELLRNHNDGLSNLENEQRKVLVAAIDNLVDFAVAEQYQMAYNLPEEIDLDDNECVEECDNVFKRYNGIYAKIENEDIKYAMAIASMWIRCSSDTVITYMTQGDNRVRPWHLTLEGTSYRKSEFPAWLIPPIEHGCRCFLVEESLDMFNQSDIASVENKAPLKMPEFVSPVFTESVATGGRIFSDAHSYFTIKKKDKKKLSAIAKRIKKKWVVK